MMAANLFLGVCLFLLNVVSDDSLERVTGNVIDAEGRAVEFAEVRAELVDSQGEFFAVATRTDIYGDFSFEKSIIDASAVGYVQFGCIDPKKGIGCIKCDKSPGKVLQGLTIKLQTSEPFTIQVVDDDGNGIQEARIDSLTYVNTTGDSELPLPYTDLLTDAEGKITIPALPRTGKIVFRIQHPDYVHNTVYLDLDLGENQIHLKKGREIAVILACDSTDVDFSDAVLRFNYTSAGLDFSLRRFDKSGNMSFKFEDQNNSFKVFHPKFIALPGRVHLEDSSPDRMVVKLFPTIRIPRTSHVLER